MDNGGSGGDGEGGGGGCDGNGVVVAGFHIGYRGGGKGDIPPN